jgi:hypothetical protein
MADNHRYEDRGYEIFHSIYQGNYGGDDKEVYAEDI